MTTSPGGNVLISYGKHDVVSNLVHIGARANTSSSQSVPGSRKDKTFHNLRLRAENDSVEALSSDSDSVEKNRQALYPISILRGLGKC